MSLLKPIVACITVVCMIGCTTLQTQKLVVSEPMTQDTEARVLRETGISGAIIGGLGAGLATFGATFLIATLAGADPAQAAIIAGGAGGVAAIGGSAYGYNAGKKQGQKIVASAMRRDQLETLLAGAKAYNARLAKVNARLSKEMKKIHNQPYGPEKKRAYSQIAKVSVREISEASKRIEQRRKALQNPAWVDTQKTQYRQELQILGTERNDLQEIYTAANNLALK